MSLRDMFLDGVRKIDEIIKYARIDDGKAEIDASELRHKELNDLLRECALRGGEKDSCEECLWAKIYRNKTISPKSKES